MFLEISNLSFKYDTSAKYVLENFSLTVDKGEIVCIVGESGSGKSTILRLIAGLEIPESGTIKVNGKIFFDKNIFVPPEKRNIGFMFQDYVLFPHFTVSQNILFGVRSKDSAERLNILNRLLKLLKIEELKDRYPYQLSGGQQQRVALARALAIDPQLILMDEPFSSLDAGLRKSIRNEMKNILKLTNKTCIFVSHDQDDALDMADRILLLDGGRITEATILKCSDKNSTKFIQETDETYTDISRSLTRRT
ncbi:ABC transporter ATP-binding protein [Fervidobacterium islandicum]|uniref:ABC transporter ATP-binding protein n=1 Tax=Fervidobacterium islandicum TaxID=2423 RepID=UPI003A6A9A3B